MDSKKYIAGSYDIEQESIEAMHVPYRNASAAYQETRKNGKVLIITSNSLPGPICAYIIYLTYRGEQRRPVPLPVQKVSV